MKTNNPNSDKNEEYDEDNLDDIDEIEEILTFHPITNPTVSFSKLSDSINYDVQENNFNLFSHLLICTKQDNDDNDDDDDDDEKLIILINKCRKAIQDGEHVNYYLKSEEDDETMFYKPVLEDDAYLQSLDDILDLYHKSKETCTTNNDNSEDYVEVEDNKEESVEALKERIESLQDQLILAKQYIQKLTFPTSNPKSLSAAPEAEQKVGSNKRKDDTPYFSSYSQTYIHEQMLLDNVRTEAYQTAITNTSYFNNKVVLDVGCGTGILSMFALKSNAQKVYAVDNSDIVPVTNQIFTLNGYSEDKVQLIQGKMEDLDELIITEKVDVIISEWMGYALLFESMLPSVLYARDTFLKPNGTLFPSACMLYLEGASSTKDISYWENVYGTNMSPMKALIVKERRSEAMVEVVPASDIVTNQFSLLNLDLYTCAVKDLDFTSKFELYGSGIVHKLVLSFDVTFPSSDQTPVVLSTTCQESSTHWKQTTVWLTNDEHGIELKENQTYLKGTFEIKTGVLNHRELEFVILWELCSVDKDGVLKNGCIHSKLAI